MTAHLDTERLAAELRAVLGRHMAIQARREPAPDAGEVLVAVVAAAATAAGDVIGLIGEDQDRGALAALACDTLRERAEPGRARPEDAPKYEPVAAE